MKRREFLIKSSTLTTAFAFTGLTSLSTAGCGPKKKSFEISLAQWSLHRSLRSMIIDHLDFITITRTKFDIGAVEYVNTFFCVCFFRYISMQ